LVPFCSWRGELVAQPAGAVGRDAVDSGGNLGPGDDRVVHRPGVEFQAGGMDFLGEGRIDREFEVEIEAVESG
jgi:hypothetical protein